MSSFFICVDVTSEAVYELVTEPIQEPPAEEQPTEEAVDQVPGEITNPADLQGKPQSISLIFNTPCFT